MAQRFRKTYKTISIMLMVFLFLLLLTPWFMAHSAYFGWGFAAIIFVSLPLLFVVPCLLVILMLLSYYFNLPKQHGLWVLAILLCLFNVYFIWF